VYEKGEYYKTMRGIAELIRLLNSYISRKRGHINTREISNTLESLVRKDETPDVLINNVDMGIKFFNTLCKYFPVRLSVIQKFISSLENITYFPSVIAKIVLNLSLSGKIRMYGEVKVRGITLGIIKKGIRRLREVCVSCSKLEPSFYPRQSIGKFVRLCNLVNDIKTAVVERDIKSLIYGASHQEPFQVDPYILVHSRKEIVLKILAVLKYMGEKELAGE